MLDYKNDFEHFTFLAKHVNDKTKTSGTRMGWSEALNGVRALQEGCFLLSKNAGWHREDSSNPLAFATKIALIHSEVSEALEGFRKNLMDDHLKDRKAVEVELADAVIRIMDLAGALNLDLGGAIVEKLAYNQVRADHKPEARAETNGKKF